MLQPLSKTNKYHKRDQQYPAALFLKVLSCVPQFCNIQLWSNNPHQFDFRKLNTVNLAAHILSFCLTHVQAYTQTRSPLLASFPWWVREIYGEKLGSSSAVFPWGGVTATFVCQGSSRWRKKQAPWSQRTGTFKSMCIPSEKAEPLSNMKS